MSSRVTLPPSPRSPRASVDGLLTVTRGYMGVCERPASAADPQPHPHKSSPLAIIWLLHDIVLTSTLGFFILTPFTVFLSALGAIWT